MPAGALSAWEKSSAWPWVSARHPRQEPGELHGVGIAAGERGTRRSQRVGEEEDRTEFELSGTATPDQCIQCRRAEGAAPLLPSSPPCAGPASDPCADPASAHPRLRVARPRLIVSLTVPRRIVRCHSRGLEVDGGPARPSAGEAALGGTCPPARGGTARTRGHDIWGGDWGARPSPSESGSMTETRPSAGLCYRGQQSTTSTASWRTLSPASGGVLKNASHPQRGQRGPAATTRPGWRAPGEPMTSFAELGVRPRTLESLTRQGIEAPNEVQREALPHLLAGHDAVIAAPTGSERPSPSPSP